ncbi:DUF4406 domain-containing protein [Aeromonas hydrophila]|uniref:DUF4406 domain-containing protein n=1 Tax=Aeromonas hydrophila TaxID=644 RepID=UPI001F377788|nr:DUF4406 domain-containing protein [Aeromonas hydrophila]BDC81810.1 hypothetical protein NUITMVA1_17530 [Aeromonas hydrophila]
MKIYIAGPMTGLPDFNRPAFYGVMREISHAKVVPLNPAILPDGLEQHEYMAICIEMVKIADALVMLPGWEGSEGAFAEYTLAKKLGKRILMMPEMSFFLDRVKAGKEEGEAACTTN